jgi:hypothetical protein
MPKRTATNTARVQRIAHIADTYILVSGDDPNEK